MSAAPHRYVYYRVGRAHLVPVLGTVRRLQQRWRELCPGLDTELYVRDEGSGAGGEGGADGAESAAGAEDAHGAGAPATVMEVWRWTGDAAAGPLPPWDDIEEDLLGATLGWLDGRRHVERFRRA